MRSAVRSLVLVIALQATFPARGADPASAASDSVSPDRAGVEFFEAKVRPVLAEHCGACHSAKAKAVKGGLRLDTRAGMLKGGDLGPAVVPGEPEQSLLIQAVRQQDESLKMPPKSKLPAGVVADLARWIAIGAPMPSDATPAASVSRARIGAIDADVAARHWSFRPIRDPAIPEVKDRGWPASSIDRFILAKLEAKGLRPSPAADRATIIRRVYYDLIGLPPAAEEAEAFERDAAPDALARVVDRLLASPQYGERWGRHWLDVARFADTKDGVLMFGSNRVRPYAYTYRDYVIRAVNEDLPFDRFVHEQLAADQVVSKDEPWRLAAMGFLTLGRGFDNNIHDQVDDKIDTVTRGLLGLTVACARCHDHKYDPIPTADYYALYGVFAGSEAPFELPPTARPDEWSAPGRDFEAGAEIKRKELREMLDAQFALLSDQARRRVGDYLVRVATEPPDPLETAIFFLSLAPEDLRPQIVSRWRRLIERRAKADDPVFGPWHDLMKWPAADFAAASRKVIAAWNGRREGTSPGEINPLVKAALAGAKLDTKADVARAYGALMLRVYEESRGARGEAPGSENSSCARSQILELIAGQESPAYFPRSQTRSYMSRMETDSFGGKLNELDRMAAESPSAPPRAMVLVDMPTPYEPRIFVRGNPSQPGERVPRRFLRILAGADRRPFEHGGGRLDLARAITAPGNPLTSRVLVNRVWMHHFGEPLVSTPSDFGSRSNPPSHPELLDHLAAAFVREGWSLKALHRSIVLSSAYRQASVDRPDCRAIDPENRLIWKYPRRRLDLEAMRDTLLFVSGRLDPKPGGRPVDVANDPTNRRRTVYGMVDRQSLPAVFRAFDFASPDQSAERRPSTTVPQQALFGMNSPFVIEQARALAARPEVAAEPSPGGKVAALHRLVFRRAPDPFDVDRALRFLAAEAAGDSPKPATHLTPLQQYAQVLLMTNELMFVD